VGAVDYRVNERRRRMQLSAVLHVASHGIAAMYCLITLREPNRPLMLVAYACGMAAGVVGVWAAKTVTTKASGYRVSFAILLISLAAVAIGAYWDGGADSPAALGFVSTAVFLAIYTPHLRLMVGLEALNIGTYLLVGVTGQPPRPGHVFIQVAGMFCLISVCGTQAQMLARQRAQLRSLAELDPLTGALNRRGLAELAERLFTSPRGLGPSVVCLDLDDFKLVNDRLGHGAGDELLQWTVAAARDVLRAGDAIARTGGDEFIVILVDADEAAAQALASRIGGVVRQRTGVSIGSASAPTDGDTLEALIEAADARLYRVKRERHGGVNLRRQDRHSLVSGGSDTVDAP
jgi:diguanylate cyclase (GGDEF)-like protein